MHKDGHIAITETRGVPVKDNGGKVVGYRGVDRDITEKKEMEERRVKSERFAGIGALATMVAHDLRNPLQGIGNGVYFLKELLSKRQMEIWLPC